MRILARLAAWSLVVPINLAQQPAPTPAPTPPAGAQASPVQVTGMPAGAPLRVAAEATADRLIVHVQLEPGWHLYGRDTGGGQPVRIDCSKDSGFVAAGELQRPMDSHGQITGKADLVLPLRPGKTGAALAASMRFMVCDALQCLPPIELTLTGAPAAATAQLRVLLVGIADDARRQRIAAFLQQRGCAVTETTWQQIDRAQCDAADVVLVDSPLSGHTQGGDVKRFPTTDAPVVAVGLLGTRLLEAQKVTLACGYI